MKKIIFFLNFLIEYYNIFKFTSLYVFSTRLIKYENTNSTINKIKLNNVLL